MAEYKFYYGNARGRGELIRLIFAAGGQEFNDIRYEFSEWPTYKPKAPFGQMPFLEVTEGGSSYIVSQSVSIARFLAKRFGLYGKDDVEQIFADMYADQVSDVVNEYVHFTWHEKDETKKKELQDKFFAETVPKNLAFFEKRLTDNKGHLAGSALTYADFHLYAWLESLGEKRDALIDGLPAVKALVNEIKTHPRIAAYLAKRPVTPF